MTDTAVEMLESVPANALFGIRVVQAGPAGAEVSLTVTPGAANVIGSLHSSGLVALLDAAGLAALIGAAGHPETAAGILPLGSRAEVHFRAPARGTLTAHCALAAEDRERLTPFWRGETDRAQLSTAAVVHDAPGTLVCDGTFTWSLRRRPPS